MHLQSWVNLSAKTAFSYAAVFKLHFYRNIVIDSRYRGRLRGSVAGLDAALADYLSQDAGTSPAAIRKYRERILHRLNRDARIPDAHA